MMVYLPFGQPVQVSQNWLAGQKIRISWFDPRTGTNQLADIAQTGKEPLFSPPSSGEDWVLIIDAGYGF
jgi:hypothetical protein